MAGGVASSTGSPEVLGSSKPFESHYLRCPTLFASSSSLFVVYVILPSGIHELGMSVT